MGVCAGIESAKALAVTGGGYKRRLQTAVTNSSCVISETETNEYEDVVFKVQILASSKKMDTKPSNFQGLKDVSRDKEGGLFKYYYGDTSDYNKITLMKTFAQEKGYPSAYIVAFKKGEKVKLSQVLTSKDK